MEATTPDSTFSRLQEIVAQLRGDKGCPWDKRQNPHSLKKYIQEEGDELLQAIASGNNSAVAGEIGDLLFVLALLMAVYQDQDAFTSEDVFSGVIAKMIHRHPHVFAGQPLPGDEAALRAQWKRLKEEEHAHQHDKDVK